MCFDTVRLGRSFLLEESVAHKEIDSLIRCLIRTKKIISTSYEYKIESIFIDRKQCLEGDYKRVYQRRIKISDINNQKKGKEIYLNFQPLPEMVNAFDYKFTFHFSRFKSLQDFLNFYLDIFPNSQGWKLLLFNSEFTEVHLKRDFYRWKLDFFKNHLMYRYARKSHIYADVENGEVKARTLYFNQNYYAYEKPNKIRLEYRVKKRKEVFKKIGLRNFSDLWEKFPDLDLSTLWFIKHTQFKDSFGRIIGNKPWTIRHLNEFNFELTKEIENEKQKSASGVRYYNVFNHCKTKRNTLMRNRFQKELVIFFPNIEVNLVAHFEAERKLFFKNLKEEYMTKKFTRKEQSQANDKEKESEVFETLIDVDQNVKTKSKLNMEDIEMVKDSRSLNTMASYVPMLPDELSLREKQFINLFVIKELSHDKIVNVMHISKTTSILMSRNLKEHIKNVKADWYRVLAERAEFSRASAFERDLKILRSIEEALSKKVDEGEIEKLSMKDLYRMKKNVESEINSVLGRSKYVFNKGPVDTSGLDDQFEELDD